ncbi:cytoplasmic tRNA 2-thiolation protein 2-A-like [Saccoglossus kowalevskii]
MHKRLRFHSGIVYIDEGAVTNKNKEKRLQVSDSVQSIMRRYDFPTHIATLEQVFDLERSSVDENPTTDVGDRVAMAMPSLSADMGDLTLDSVQTKRLKYMLANTKSVTAKEDLVQILRHRLLMDIARRYGYDKIMLGDCSTKLSISILADLAKGRGASIPLDTNFADRRYGDVFFLRPMREFTSKEIGIYNHFHNIDSVVIASLTTKCPVNASINRLTETFVTGLQVDFPSTVNTVFRTGEKLCVTDSSDNSPVQYCILCRDTDNLPGFIIEEARRRIRRSQMKKEFEGFLLEED